MTTRTRKPLQVSDLATSERGALSRVYRGVTECIDMRLAATMERRRLVVRHHVYERTEWNKVVARLRVVTLTELGKRLAKELVDASPETARLRDLPDAELLKEWNEGRINAKDLVARGFEHRLAFISSQVRSPARATSRTRPGPPR